MRLKIFIVLFSLCFTILLTPEKFISFDESLNFILPIVGLFNIAIFVHERLTATKTWISLENLFLFGYIIVHFQIPFFHSLGWEPFNPDFVFINKAVVNYGTWLSTMAILLWMLGFYIYPLKKLNSQINLFTVNIGTVNRLQFLILLLFPIFIFLVGNSFLQGNYDGGSNWNVGASYIYLLLHLSILLYISLVFYYIPKGKNIYDTLLRIFLFDMKSSIIILSYFFIFLSAGDRGPVIQISILVLFMISYKHVKISGIKVLLLLIVGASLMTIVKYGRTGGTDVRGDINVVAHGMAMLKTNDAAFNPTLELALSNRILFQALNSVPKQHDYLYGLTMFGDISSGIPFLAGILKNNFNFPTVYASSTYFFTYLGQGMYPTYGEGSELLADIYINGGIFLVMIIMFLLGILMSFLSNNFGSNNSFLFIFYLVLLVNSIYMSRAPLFQFFQPLILTYIIFKIVSFEKR